MEGAEGQNSRHPAPREFNSRDLMLKEMAGSPLLVVAGGTRMSTSSRSSPAIFG
jgi:hypothetical protein